MYLAYSKHYIIVSYYFFFWFLICTRLCQTHKNTRNMYDAYPVPKKQAQHLCNGVHSSMRLNLTSH